MKTATARQATHTDEPIPVLVDRRLKSLPRAAVERFMRLQKAEGRTRALASGLWVERADAIEARDEALRALGMFDRDNPPNVYVTRDPKTGEETGRRSEFPPERAGLVARVEHAKAEIARIDEERREATTGLNTEEILNWLGSRADQKFVAVPFPKLSFTRVSSLEEMLEENRIECASIRDQIEVTAAAPITTAEAKVRMREDVARLAERGRPEVANLLAGASIRWPTQQVVTTGEHLSAATIDDGLALAIWANRDAIIAALDNEIERGGDDDAALSAEDRSARVHELEAKLTDLHRLGEAIATKIEQHGRVARRHCLDPMILLGIAEA